MLIKLGLWAHWLIDSLWLVVSWAHWLTYDLWFVRRLNWVVGMLVNICIVFHCTDWIGCGLIG